MLILILSIVALGIFAALYSLLSSRGKHDDEPIKVAQTCATCDGTPTTKCEQDCMMEASTKPIEYFDDEELDSFIGRPADSYTDDETEQFSDVLYTCVKTRLRHGAEALTSAAYSCQTRLRTRL